MISRSATATGQSPIHPSRTPSSEEIGTLKLAGQVRLHKQGYIELVPVETVLASGQWDRCSILARGETSWARIGQEFRDVGNVRIFITAMPSVR